MDRALVRAFLKTVIADGNRAAAILMAAMGDALGLFEALAAGGPATSVELAERTGLQERYLREWLAGMLAAGYLTYDAASEQFTLPAEHAPVLADEAGPLFLGGTLQMLLGMLGPIPQVLRAFREGGGVPIPAYDVSVWEGMERNLAGLYEARLTQQWVPLMPEVQALLERGARVADAGSGGGRALRILARAYPASTFVGFDLHPPNVERATRMAVEAGLAERLRFQVADVVCEVQGSFEVILGLDIVHDVANPQALLRAVRAALVPGGRFVCLEIRAGETVDDQPNPLAVLDYGFSLLYCMTTSLAQNGSGLGTLGLPASRLKAMCLAAGFADVREVPIESGFHVLFEAIA